MSTRRVSRRSARRLFPEPPAARHQHAVAHFPAGESAATEREHVVEQFHRVVDMSVRNLRVLADGLPPTIPREILRDWGLAVLNEFVFSISNIQIQQQEILPALEATRSALALMLLPSNRPLQQGSQQASQQASHQASQQASHAAQAAPAA